MHLLVHQGMQPARQVHQLRVELLSHFTLLWLSIRQQHQDADACQSSSVNVGQGAGLHKHLCCCLKLA